MYLDANFFIYLNFSTGRKATKARKILLEILNGKQAITSSLTLDEIMWVIRKRRLSQERRPVVEWIYAIRNLKIVQVSSLAPLRALAHIERHRLRPRDALHLAVMEQYRETEIVTSDADFDNIPGFTRVAF